MLFYIILSIIIFDFLFTRLLEYLNASHFNKPIPSELSDIYDSEKYYKQQAYEKTNYYFSSITSIVNIILILSMLSFDGFEFTDIIAHSITNHPIMTSLVFFAILFFASDIINLPFALYDTFVIEQKFGFNKTTLKIFILDKLKSWLLIIIIGGCLLYFIIWIYIITGTMFWILTWLVVSIFLILMAMFYSSIIVPLFNKQTPLEPGTLRDEIEKFSKQAGFNLSNIYTIDGSKRSTKANAYFSGLGKKKRIVLFDTLIAELNTSEIVAVLAHEIGHYKLKHTLLNIVISILSIGLMLFVLSLFIENPELSQALGVSKPSFHISIITFAILYSPLSNILGIAMNIISRKNEFAADNFAAKYGYSKPLIQALKKLSKQNLSNLTPHPIYAFVYYSHPPLLQRIRNLISKL